MVRDGKGRVALVTGGTGGIGKAICIRLAKENYVVATNYRTEEKKQQAEEEFQKAGVRVHFFKGDVLSEESVNSMCDAIRKELGPILVLVNNAGITRDRRFVKMTFEDWDIVLRTNLYSVFICTKAVINDMIQAGWGRIINISSVNGEKGQFGQVNYAAAKSGMYGFTKSLAQEVAQHGITVNCISPGYIATEMVMAVREDIRQAIINSIPLKRLGTPEEVAAVVSFLASDEASYFTGANISMNGGLHM